MTKAFIKMQKITEKNKHREIDLLAVYEEINQNFSGSIIIFSSANSICVT